MTPINHYEGDRPNVMPALLPVTAPMLFQENYPDGTICFFNGWQGDKPLSRTVAIFRITYKSK